MKKLTLKTLYNIAIVTTAILIYIDQFTKSLAISYLKDTDGISIIDGVFRLEYLENRGAAFGIMQGQQTYFMITTAVVIIGIIYIYAKIPTSYKFLPLRGNLILLSAGAIGNFIDRITLNYVVDFLYFELIDFPIFNVADIYVTVTVAIFIFLILLYYKDEELDQIKLLPSKKK